MVEYKHYKYEKDGSRCETIVSLCAGAVHERIATDFVSGIIHNLEVLGTIRMASSAGKDKLPQVMMVVSS